MCISCVGITSGCYVGFLTAEARGVSIGIPDLNLITFTATALGVTGLANIIVAGTGASVPAERLLGVPAKDIEQYSKIYIDTVKDKRVKYSFYGSGSTCLVFGVLTLIYHTTYHIYASVIYSGGVDRNVVK